MNNSVSVTEKMVIIFNYLCFNRVRFLYLVFYTTGMYVTYAAFIEPVVISMYVRKDKATFSHDLNVLCTTRTSKKPISNKTVTFGGVL